MDVSPSVIKVQCIGGDGAFSRTSHLHLLSKLDMLLAQNYLKR